MPEESKKQKGKHEPKDQRRRGRQRQPAGPVEQKPEKQPEVPKEPEKPAYEPPGPEFYKNLKRETDEILKITEEANTKYKKKEIQSNWAKYEMPVESYEEIEEQENLGADYEKLIQAPASAGGHFQFKHEKSWDTENGPSVYDKYFNINMDLLSLALSTIPFYERNNIESSIFNENDVLTMNHRATKFKQKYYNDKKYSTPELEAQDKILQKLTSQTNKVEVKNDDNLKSGDDFLCEKPIDINKNVFAESATEVKVDTPKSIQEKLVQESKQVEVEPEHPKPIEQTKQSSEINIAGNETKPSGIVVKANELEEIDLQQSTTVNASNKLIDNDEVMLDNNISYESRKNNVDMKITEEIEKTKKEDNALTKAESHKEIKTVEAKPKVTKEATPPKNPLIESPEDLEKWLDDFLDG